MNKINILNLTFSTYMYHPISRVHNFNTLTGLKHIKMVYLNISSIISF